MDTLIHERQKADFDVQAMKVVFWGGPSGFQLAHRLAQLVASDPVPELIGFPDGPATCSNFELAVYDHISVNELDILKKDNRATLTREELIKSGLRKAVHVRKLVLDYHLSDREALLLRVFADERSYADLHWNMFVPALEGQATPEQLKYWLPLARNMKIIGCYAQTELGHGSNVRGLETTATFDPSTSEFIVNSPTVTSTKWWPGGLGKIATHAVVQARLITNKQDYGVHAFIVQVRSLEDHTPLPGIIVGEIGTKFGNGGNNTVDNGFLRFNSVRIPRTNMLMRMAEVTKEGIYRKSNVPQQILYGAMVTAREIIISEAALNLSRAVTIAVRYSAVRRQFGSKEGMPEVQVIDYLTQQKRLFPLIASAYAFQFAAHWLRQLYEEVQSRLRKNDFSNLAEVHGCTAGLKAITTSVTAVGIEECRKLCGGHGYLCSSGLPELYAAYIPAVTYEGENILLFREVGKLQIRTVFDFKRGIIPTGTSAYIRHAENLLTNNCMVEQGKDFLNEQVILEAFEARAIRLTYQCAEKVQALTEFQEGLDKYAEEIVNAARAHCELMVVSKFHDKLKEEILGLNVKKQLRCLYYVYTLNLIQDNLGDFLLTGYMTRKQAFLVQDLLYLLFKEVRANAVALVDSFNHTDHFLSSTLGSYDGDVYNRLYQEALNDPSNKKVVVDGYHDYVRPLLHQNGNPLSKL